MFIGLSFPCPLCAVHNCWHRARDRRRGCQRSCFHAFRLPHGAYSSLPSSVFASAQPSTGDGRILLFLPRLSCPSFRIDLLLMPEHHRGRGWQGVEVAVSCLTGFFISEKEVWFTSAVGRELSSGDLRANGLDLCTALLLSVWTKLEEAEVTDLRSFHCVLLRLWWKLVER